MPSHRQRAGSSSSRGTGGLRVMTVTMTVILPSTLMAILASAAAADTSNNDNGGDDDGNLDDDRHDRPSFDFLGLLAFLAAVGGLGYAALKLAGRGDLFGETGYLAEQERLMREEAARQAEEEKGKESEYQLK